MRSLIAALQSLTLPNGATTGTRIVLDSTNGVILVYNASDQLIGSIAPSNNAGQWVAGVAAYEYDGSNVGFYTTLSGGQINFGPWNGLAPFTANGFIQLDDAPGTLRLVAPTYDANGHCAGLDLNSQNSVFSLTNSQAVFYDADIVSPTICDILLSGFVYRTTSGSQEEWNVFTLQNGWSQSANQHFGYKLHADGYIRFRGEALVGTAADGTVIANVPAGYRPTNNLVQTVTRDGIPGQSRIVVRGTVAGANAGNIEVYDVSTSAGLNFDQVQFTHPSVL